MRAIAEIDADIAKVKAELEDVHGTQTEVYARIVGYYRSVRNWNKGKREEYRHRKLFVADETNIQAHLPAVGGCACGSDAYAGLTGEAAISSAAASTASRYELFVRKTCPNCPPVKECCTNLPLSGDQIDVDQSEGFARASAAGVFSTPTVVFYDASDAETGRAYSVKEIRALPCLAKTADAAPALF
jgi:hypothetical protein